MEEKERCPDIYCQKCALEHDEFGGNYVWLQALGHGPVEDIWFEEPVNSNNWRRYDWYWWKVHCDAVNHGKDLIEAHMEAFVYPKTRFARLMFLFKDRTLQEPTREFYELEYAYFKEFVTDSMKH